MNINATCRKTPEGGYVVERNLELHCYQSATDTGFAEALGIYIQYIPAHCRTDTNEIAYWVDLGGQVSADVETYCCGLMVNGAVMGFAHWAGLRKIGVAFLDYIAIAPEARTPGNLSAFFHLLATAAQQDGFEIALTEVVEDPVRVRFARLQGFREIKAPYYQPPLGRGEPFPSALMVLGLEGKLAAQDYERWIHEVYFGYYEPWHRPFLSDGEATHYWAALDDLETRIKKTVPAPILPVKGGGIDRLFA